MKALIVDNDRISRAVIKRLLSHLNVEVVEADNGLAALQQLELVDPDFLVLDIEMPILSGLEALSAIRQSPLRADVPVICVSASSTKEHVTSMLGLGVADYILKPINPVDALPRFKTVMLRSTQWRQRREGGSFNTLLLVDADPNFLAFARPLLDQEFEITDISSSTQAAVCFQESMVKPSLVCMAEGLPLMSEDVLVDVIRKMSILPARERGRGRREGGALRGGGAEVICSRTVPGGVPPGGAARPEHAREVASSGARGSAQGTRHCDPADHGRDDGQGGLGLQ
jgi:CheY-like chemotaxis protein